MTGGTADFRLAAGGRVGYRGRHSAMNARRLLPVLRETLRRLLPLLSLALVPCGLRAADPTSWPGRAGAVVDGDRPVVIAHRGFSMVAPENTAPAFELALMAGADLVELDYHHTADGIPVVIHDGTLDRTTDARRRFGGTNLAVGRFPLERLRRLEAGSWFAPRYLDARLLSLTEALEVIQPGSVTLIERKGGDAATCARLVRDLDLVNAVVVQSFDWDYLADYHRAEPGQILGALGPWGSFRGEKLSDDDKWLSIRWIEAAQEIGARIVVWNRQVRADAVRAAHERGMKVWCYTINDEAPARELLGAGVDGLITDNPARMWRILATGPAHTRSRK